MGDSPELIDGAGIGPSAAELEAAGQESMFGAPPATPATCAAPQPPTAQPYRVLARKYRPQSFAGLIGQEAMVQTLANAIRRDRIAHAFLMTGVRGVGKTSTARLIAKALNCIGADGAGGPTIDPCGVCDPCRAIAEGRHIDVIEMDAASHTGIDDVREIIEAVRYAAVSARYKIYIIDEVHMLSKNAFNGLLKTLEEPPAHVKFLFATTEVDKLPVTVLSRCQRFDLRRIPAARLAEHYAWICAEEGVAAEAEALAIIAEAAEGSVRDGLSILDQAIAHADLDSDILDAGAAAAGVTAERVRAMLGLAERGAGRRLFAALLGGEGGALLDLIAAQYALGIEPLALLRVAMQFTHRVTLAQVTGTPPEAIAPEEAAAIAGWAARLSAGQLHRLWQLLAKGFDEVKAAPEPLIAAQMALLRCLHAADLPDPGELARRIEDLAAHGAPAMALGSGAAGQTPAAAPQTAVLDWPSLVDRVEQVGELVTASKMRMQCRVVQLAAGQLCYALSPGFRDDITVEIRAALVKATGEAWQVELVASGGAPSLEEARLAAAAEADATLRASPLVAAALAAFPGAAVLDDDAQPARSNG